MSRSGRTLGLLSVFAGSVALVAFLAKDCAPSPTDGPTAATSASSSGSALPAGVDSGPAYPLLDGLKAGDTLDDWTVSRILINESVEQKPQLAIELERKGSGITIWVTRKGNAKNPASSTEKYALSFGHGRPYGDPIPDDAYTKMMNVIAERLRRTEATVEPPPGL
jgi:hypothetical protein